MWKNRENRQVPRRWHLPAALLGVAWACTLVRAEVGDASMDERQQRVRAMSAEEFDRLRRNYRHFESLPADEKDRLRRLYEQIEAHPDRAQLRAVMENYYRWVRRLSPAERDELLSTPPAERLAKVLELRQRPARGRRPFRGSFRGPDRGRFRPFPIGPLLQELVDEKLTDAQRKELARAERFERLRLLLRYAREQQLLAGTKPLGTDKVSEDRLRAIIRNVPGLAKLTPAAQRERLGWSLRLWAARLTPRNEAVPSVPEDELQKFFTEEVQQSQVAREHFEQMGGADRVRESAWKRDLTLLYLEAHPERRPPAPAP
jgi:hypothetical protein